MRLLAEIVLVLIVGMFAWPFLLWAAYVSAGGTNYEPGAAMAVGGLMSLHTSFAFGILRSEMTKKGDDE